MVLSSCKGGGRRSATAEQQGEVHLERHQAEGRGGDAAEGKPAAMGHVPHPKYRRVGDVFDHFNFLHSSQLSHSSRPRRSGDQTVVRSPTFIFRWIMMFIDSRQVQAARGIVLDGGGDRPVARHARLGEALRLRTALREARPRLLRGE